ncbi:hypothetical protein BD410DRAFT_811243 [Rickenella mellea]|uniref:RNA splicing factor PRP9 n=1 Tax=Rickenella mellea TaxID=50990 RepID=A0A4R5XFW6_9AGAM|nr:hypothetical protein BD410DRAFT_811243 [Rickenella mellea]
MDSIIEVQRQTHEEIERFNRALATVLSKPQTTQQSKLANEHKASQLLDRISSRVTTLNNAYQEQTVRKAEIDALSAESGSDELSDFYARLGKIKEYHLKYPDIPVGGFELELEGLVESEFLEGDEDYGEEDPISLLFSGEEAYGRYLDLYVHHSTYNNLKNIGKRLGYLQYLDTLLAAQHSQVHIDLPKDIRQSKDFETYITALCTYLLSFLKRTQPLVNIAEQQSQAEVEFDSLWAEGKIEGWEEMRKEQPKTSSEGEGVWCSSCQKLYSKQTVYDAHLTSKKHLKASARQATAGAPPSNPNGPDPSSDAPTKHRTSEKSKIRSTALATYLVTSLLASLAPTLNETKSNVERRFSLTAREREAELLEKPVVAQAPVTNTEDAGAAEEEEEEEERIYNPLKLPLGWDGKPIPYWLYKLHGLGVEYRCEICSDHVYMGRKNFDRHFQESRHAFGMRALGLPNTKHFHEITRIEDALSLAEKLKQEGKQEIFQQETMEELEDDEGNVYNRKTYEDLKKQGLI